MHHPSLYLDLNQTEHQALFENCTQVWDALKQIESYLQSILKPANEGKLIGQPFIGSSVYIGKDSLIENGATIKGPAWIGNNCQIRSGCYIRENVIVGNNVVLGNSCEFKNCIIFNGAEIPHFNYVGDSILGYKAHLGAGVILSNYRLDHSEIIIRTNQGVIATGLRKFGAILGNHAEIGCNSVLNPGTLIGRNSIVYPLSSFGGILDANSILKNRQEPPQIFKRQ
jgi:UDP-N-acetylglucosamine diphosphorylase / glucose-1-phosphate thymidylyltransferase / UDP-N-acetylgalactosamine diphosphorylase / glucosamine-1-phosphate N-acetyltransferase / galactosamine-1-phosphate N-acetyltransferase